MKVVILAGGLGIRISEESHLKPKPMIEIGDMPILWHIMKIYSHFGFNDFIICAGYKSHVIKEYFANYYLHRSDITFDFAKGGEITVHNNAAESWRVTVVDTGLNTMTGGRVKRVRQYVGDETFMLTYGDGVSDLDINELLRFHKSCGSLATLTAVQPGGRFGSVEIDKDSRITTFVEKSKEEGGWISGGFMVLEPEIFDCIEDDDTILEREPFERLAALGQLSAYRYNGFWRCMDSLRDKSVLEDLIAKGEAPWVRF
jgi:glucose-1-phosphate cytidylyltransferase